MKQLLLLLPSTKKTRYRIAQVFGLKSSCNKFLLTCLSPCRPETESNYLALLDTEERK